MCSIQVDSRESKLWEALSGFKYDACITLQQAQLEVGDVRITCPGLVFLFERKTGADLAASIKDGRYREQKMRMGAVTQPKFITYFIENINGCHLPKSVSHGMIVNTMYRDGMHVIITKSTAETAEWLYIIASKIASNPSKYQAHPFLAAITGGNQMDVEAPKTEYIDMVKIKSRKIENIDKKTCYLMQLGQIPGVSSRIAEILYGSYPTMFMLLKALHESDDPVKLLCKLPLIGEKKAKTILDFVL